MGLEVHRDSIIHGRSDVSQLISRENTYISAKHIPARVNLTLISREYTYFPSQSTPAQAGFTMICAEICFEWDYVATRVAYFDRFRGMDTSGLPDFLEFRCILLGDTSESDVLGTSRCIWNTWFYAHTSELPDLGSFRCIITLVSVGDTSGLRFQCPSRCTWVQIYL